MARLANVIDALWPVELIPRSNGFPLRMEEVRSNGSLVLRMEIPGVNPARDVDVCIEDGVLTVSGQRTETSQTPQQSEFAYGEFTRMVTLPRGTDEDSIRASYHEGILEITMDVPTHTGAPRHIAVSTGRAPD